MNPKNNQQNQKPQRQGLIHESQIPPGEIKPQHLAATATMAKGDLYYSDGSKFIRLPIGTNGQTLKVVNGLPQWG